jgi:phage gpG-like protein
MRHPKLGDVISFTYEDNSEAVNEALAGFKGALADNAPALRAIADDFRETIAQQFASEGRAEGTPWPARKSSRGVGTTRRVARTRRPDQIGTPLLVRTGALRDSLIGPGAAAHVEENDGSSLTLGSRLPYAMFHQVGTRHMPARPIIVLTDARSQRWTEFVRRALEEKTALLGAKELK